MGHVRESTPEEEATCAKSIATRPTLTRAVTECSDMWSFYRMKSTGNQVSIL